MTAHICALTYDCAYMSHHMSVFIFKTQDHPGGVHNLNFGDRVSDHDSNVLFANANDHDGLSTD